MLGKSYIIDHCYVELKREHENKALKNYITDSLKVIAENTAHIVGGSSMSKRYADIVAPPKPEDTRTSKEIINGIKSKLRGGEQQ